MTYIDIVFSGPPSEPATFVEVENPAGQSISVGEWLQRPDGYWVLRIPSPVAPSSSDDSVIEEAAMAIRFRVIDASWDDHATWLDMARAVFAVFEKAHAPAGDERTPAFEALEQDLFKHQPVLSMSDGHIAGCQCMDRVFHKRTEDWGTHLAEVFEALRRSKAPEPQGEPSDALRAVNDLALAAHGANSRSGDADFLRGHINHAVPIVRAALRAAGSQSATLDTVPEQRPGGHHD